MGNYSARLLMDVLLIVIYIIVVFLVLYQMSLELEDKLEDKVEIVLDKELLAEQTQTQLDLQDNPKNIKALARTMSFGKDGKKGKKGKKTKRPVLVLLFNSNQDVSIDKEGKAIQETLGMDEKLFKELLLPKIMIRVSPTGEQKLKQVQFISVIVTNDTADMQVYIDWDSSSIEMLKQGNRVVRSTPNIPIDLSQPQVPTVVNPDMTVTSSITTEKKFSRGSESSLLFAPSQPVLDFKEIVVLSKLTDPTKDMENIQSLYALDLKVKIKHRTAGAYDSINLLVPFVFQMRIKVDKPAFPPMRWWLRKFGKKREKKGNWFWGSRPPESKGG